MTKRVQVTVYGLVQGVGFRMFVHRSATRLGLKGWVKNMQDGTVRIDVQGSAGLIEKFLKDVRLGPPASKVATLAVLDKQPDPSIKAFTVLS